MNEDPYQSPTSDLGQRGQRHKNSLWWKLYFWFYMGLFALTLLAIPLLEGMSFLDYLDLGVSMVGAIALFGFAYYKPISTMDLWRYYYYVLLVETVVYAVVLPAAGYKRYGLDTEFDGAYAFELCFVGALIYAVYRYSHRCEFLWKKL